MWDYQAGSMSYITNADVNTWLSLVNYTDITSYESPGSAVDPLTFFGVKMIDLDGNSGKEAIEVALCGVEIANCYIQDKGFGLAVWNGQGQKLKKNFYFHNNVFTNVNRTPAFGFGKSAAVFVPDAAQNMKIVNNVFDNMGNGLTLDAASSVEIRNNIFLNTMGSDVENGANLTFTNNLKYHSSKAAKSEFWFDSASVTKPGNYSATSPGLNNSGDRATNWYKPASSSSFVVDKGYNVGLPIVGAAADIGYFESGYVPGPTTTTTTMVGSATLETGTYKMLNVGSNKAQQAEPWAGGSVSNADYNDANSQKWNLTAVGGCYKIINLGSAYSLNASGTTSANMQAYTGSDAQLGTISSVGAGQFKIVNKAFGSAAKPQDIWNGNALILGTFDGSSNLYKWSFGTS